MTRKSTNITRNQSQSPKSRASAAQQSAHLCNMKPPALSVVDRNVLRSGLSYDSFVRLLIQSALSRLTIWTQSDLDRLLILSERFGLDPLNNEIYATEVTPESGKRARILFVVGVDGWSKIINSHPQFDGMNFVESAPKDDELPLYIECTIYRKDRRVATSVREYMHEAHTNQGAWLTHPRRMLRHKAMVQCARTCFALGGLYEQDEAERVSSALSTHTNNKYHSTSRGGSTDPMSGAMGKPIGTDQLKGWIHQSSQAVRDRYSPNTFADQRPSHP
jgi:phage recombination protein Bet